jgi:hypothetical protein
MNNTALMEGLSVGGLCKTLRWYFGAYAAVIIIAELAFLKLVQIQQYSVLILMCIGLCSLHIRFYSYARA